MNLKKQRNEIIIECTKDQNSKLIFGLLTSVSMVIKCLLDIRRCGMSTNETTLHPLVTICKSRFIEVIQKNDIILDFFTNLKVHYRNSE